MGRYALRMVQAIERSIVRLRLECQGEFMAIINAIEMQLESRDTESDVVRLLADSMAALAAARPISERDRRTLEERLRFRRTSHSLQRLRCGALNNYGSAWSIFAGTAHSCNQRKCTSSSSPATGP